MCDKENFGEQVTGLPFVNAFFCEIKAEHPRINSVDPGSMVARHVEIAIEQCPELRLPDSYWEQFHTHHICTGAL